MADPGISSPGRSYKNTDTMKNILNFVCTVVLLTILCDTIHAQSCDGGGCSNFTNQYPSSTFSTFSTTSSSWTTVSAYMNAGNWTLFNVTQGNTYEWSYCNDFGGKQGWDAELTLLDNSTDAVLCYQDNSGRTNCTNAPYLGWTATFTGVVKLLTTESSCQSNTGSPYSTLVWRMSNGSQASTILGIDVYHNDGTINWSQFAGGGYVFAWAKATEGTTFKDPNFATYMVNGMNAGVYMGAYDFAHPESNTASAEAAYFLDVAGPYIQSCQLMPALDFETTGSLSSSTLTTWVKDWMTAVETATGITPIIYTSSSIASSLGSSVKTYPLWMANPDGSATTPPSNLGGWSTWAFKQYSWSGTVPGISSNVDMDVYNGDLNSLKILLGCAVVNVQEFVPEENFKIYPNPATEIFTVENITADTYKNERISIYDLQGRLILEQVIQDKQTDINISFLVNGMYIARISTEFGVEVKKLVKD
jgi:GH25 family lysozyme M1 (1,4-beta-N-acetylmuramidase)